MYRHRGLREHQYFVAPAWKGGAYASYGLPGSRSGGLIAATWAAGENRATNAPPKAVTSSITRILTVNITNRFTSPIPMPMTVPEPVKRASTPGATS